ncbi:MAG TPA: hypothetical protein VHU80_02975 [Polyangiaceae bacterium]|jgi:hypothetical protein|nr:hypothetical protein [Polyangiaceae bacterium]
MTKAPALLLLGLSSLVPRVSRAAEENVTRVAIVLEQGATPEASIVADLTRELVDEGFSVLATELVTDATPLAECLTRARSRGARAVLRVRETTSSSISIDVLVADHENQLALKDTVKQAADEAGDDLVAVHAVEVLRASALEVTPPPPTSPAVTTSTTEVSLDDLEEPVTRAPSEFAIVVAPELVLSGSRPLAVMEGAVTFAWTPSAHFAAEFRAVLPVSAASIGYEASSGLPEGNARVLAVGLGASHFFLSRQRTWRPFMGVRAGVLYVAIEGGQTSNVSMLFGSFVAGLSVKLSGALRLRVDASIGAAAADRSVDRTLSRLGLPFSEIEVGPELTW